MLPVCRMKIVSSRQPTARRKSSNQRSAISTQRKPRTPTNRSCCWRSAGLPVPTKPFNVLRSKTDLFDGFRLKSRERLLLLIKQFFLFPSVLFSQIEFGSGPISGNDEVPILHHNFVLSSQCVSIDGLRRGDPLSFGIQQAFARCH